MTTLENRKKLMDKTVSSSDIYKQRFIEYGQIYSDSWPEPALPAPTNSDLGAQKTVLTRKVRYNDKSTTQNSTVKGAQNA